jgi:hypothetical protein
MALAAAPKRMIVWTPELTKTLLTITGVFVVSFVAIGQYLAARQKGWRDIAEARLAAIQDMERSFATEMAAARKDGEFLALRVDALEAQLAAVQKESTNNQTRYDEELARWQRLNHLLQTRLDASEARQTIVETRQMTVETRQDKAEGQHRRHPNEETKD